MYIYTKYGSNAIKNNDFRATLAHTRVNQETHNMLEKKEILEFAIGRVLYHMCLQELLGSQIWGFRLRRMQINHMNGNFAHI